MLNRRRFLQCIVAATSSVALPGCDRAPVHHPRAGGLDADPNRLLDLAPGLEYRIVSRFGEAMSDGLRVPGAHDGMAAFPGADGRVILICNHELDFRRADETALGSRYPSAPDGLLEHFYDRGSDITPSAGGTTTIVYDPATGRAEGQFLSLAGTEMNCAGGPTPWGSWLSCEECFTDAGQSRVRGNRVIRDERHGYVFEVPAAAEGPVDPVPIRAMGRFEHEGCAVHEPSGIVYMTEDRHHGLFYRYLPDVPGRLSEGGRLQALAVAGESALATHNWTANRRVPPREPLDTYWIDLDDVDPDKNDLRLRGAELGAAMFARGEGLCNAGDRIAFTCTIGGPARLGQIFTYEPSPWEGTANETNAPGTLELVAESGLDSLLRNADNLTMAPWGDLIVCEDTATHCGLLGIRPDGSQYAIADNAYSNSELAGACFSPDGETLFVNIQYPGTTLAITGDFRQFR